MDDEQYEEIPWAALMSDTDNGVDRKVYLAVAVLAIVVVVIFAMRLFGRPTAQPAPVSDPVAPVPTALAGMTTAALPATTTTAAGIVVAEQDLMAFAGEATVHASTGPMAIAEWFVTDYFTTDGSPETSRSVRALLGVSTDDQIPHDSGEAPVRYVEWARTVASTELGDGTSTVEVLYRAIVETPEGFSRQPVAAVTVRVAVDGSGYRVLGPPVPSVLPVPVPVSAGEQNG